MTFTGNSFYLRPRWSVVYYVLTITIMVRTNNDLRVHKRRVRRKMVSKRKEIGNSFIIYVLVVVVGCRVWEHSDERDIGIMKNNILNQNDWPSKVIYLLKTVTFLVISMLVLHVTLVIIIISKLCNECYCLLVLCIYRDLGEFIWFHDRKTDFMKNELLDGCLRPKKPYTYEMSLLWDISSIKRFYHSKM